MAISFDVSKCEDFQKHFPDQGPENARQWNGLFYSLTMLMLGIGGPDPKHMDEFWARVNIYQRTIVALAYQEVDGKPEPVYATEEQIKSLANLRINVPPTSKTNFSAFLMRVLRAEHGRGTLGK